MVELCSIVLSAIGLSGKVCESVRKCYGILQRGREAAQKLDSVESEAKAIAREFSEGTSHFTILARKEAYRQEKQVDDALKDIKKPPSRPSTVHVAKRIKYEVSVMWYGIRHGEDVDKKLEALQQRLLPAYRQAVTCSDSNTRHIIYRGGPSNAVSVLSTTAGLDRADTVVEFVKNWHASPSPIAAAPDGGQPPKLCFVGIVGQGGLGKTTLLSHIVQELQSAQCFHLVGWADLSDKIMSPQDIKKEQASLINVLLEGHGTYENFLQLKDGRGKLKEVFERLANDGKSVCIVVDNVWRLDDLLELLPDMNVPSFSCCIMIASQVHGIEDGLSKGCGQGKGAIEVLPFQPELMSTKDSRELLLASAAAQFTSVNNELVEKIYPLCYNLPIALNRTGRKLGQKCSDISFWNEWVLAMEENTPGLAEGLEDLEQSLHKVYDKLSGESQAALCGIAACYAGWSEQITGNIVGPVVMDRIQEYSLLPRQYNNVNPVDSCLKMHGLIRKFAHARAGARNDIIWDLERRWSLSELRSKEFEQMKYLHLDARNAVEFSSSELIVEGSCFKHMRQLRALDVHGPFTWTGLLRLPASLRFLRFQDNHNCLGLDFAPKATSSGLQTVELLQLGLVQDTSNWMMLKVLWLEKCPNITQLPVEGLVKLQQLILSGCTCLKESQNEWGPKLSHAHIVIDKVAVLFSQPSSSSSVLDPGQGIGRAPHSSTAAAYKAKNMARMSVTGTTISQLDDLSQEQLSSLETLTISRCNEPKQTWSPAVEMESLKLLEVEDCGWTKLEPAGLFSMTRHLTKLILKKCHHLEALPESLGELEELEELEVNWCHKLRGLPDTIERLQRLERLNLDGCGKLQALPGNVTRLRGLKELSLDTCGSLQRLPLGMAGLESLSILRLSFCTSLIRDLPHSISKLHHQLDRLELVGLYPDQLLPAEIPSNSAKDIVL